MNKDNIQLDGNGKRLHRPNPNKLPRVIRGAIYQENKPEYTCWKALRARCYRKTDPVYHRYGAVGIIVCQRWLDSFNNFLEDMGKRPSPAHSIDRYPNHKGNYEPSNCRWATPLEQARNRKNSLVYTHNGITKPINDWAKEHGMTYAALWRRIKSGTKPSVIFKKGRINRYKDLII